MFHDLTRAAGQTDDDHETRMLRLSFALSYPFDVPAGSFIFIGDYGAAPLPDDQALWIGPAGTRRDLSRPEQRACDEFARFDFGSSHAVISAGSNASPMQLWRKFTRRSGANTSDPLIIPCIRVRVKNHVACYARQLAPYGSIPTNVVHEEGAETVFHVNFLTDRLLERLNETEGLGVHYELQHYDELSAVGPRSTPPMPLRGYKGSSGSFPVRSSREECHGSALPACSQRQIQERVVDALGDDRAVESFILDNVYDPESRSRHLEALRTLRLDATDECRADHRRPDGNFS